ncbi:MAG TPA: L,D-transpeptidase [Conexibacter sp.]|jgi:lipoprotein-anchoring transpeptidase ErfK/SrfK|nr:L,D-transpeptidase [Conexibacter sp.]
MSVAVRRLGFALAAAGLVLVGLVVGSMLMPGGGERGARTAGDAVAAGAAGVTAAAGAWGVDGAGGETAAGRTGAGGLPPGTSLVANVRGARPLTVYRRAGGARPVRRLAGPSARVLLVREQHGAWLRVLLPVRPNGASGWIRAGLVTLRTNPYRIDVRLRAHRLVVRRGRTVILRTPIGVGQAVTPTPRGLAYVTRLLRQPDPRGPYGPWAFGLSVYSPVLTHFGGGPGEVGIHGTNAPAGIGRDVSHGCIRLPNVAIERLARMLPLGTPVRIA